MKNIFLAACALFFFAGCSNFTTPAIEGTVIDEVTKQPVENAWLMAVVKIATYSPGGKVVNYYLLNTTDNYIRSKDITHWGKV
jgi:hypothetical protein